jgi:hypothetical protein
MLNIFDNCDSTNHKICQIISNSGLVNEADRQIDEFSELLDGVAAEVLTAQIQSNAVPDTSATLPTELIVAQIAYLEAFDEVIQKQII